jgi:hypothetical protein
MSCTSPIQGWRSRERNKNGKRPIVFDKSQGYEDMPVTLPCGRCGDCRLNYSREWATRCMHEAQMHKRNSFITLTYNEENIPNDYSVHKKELQNFFKRLRKNTGVRFKYYACGEYGEKYQRPHYHAIIFGYDFPDRKLFTKTKRGDLLFTSELLEKAWQYKGYALIGEVTYQSCAYVARYVMKKRKGKPDQVDKHGKTNEQYYEIADQETGEIFKREPEFCLPSRGSGVKDDPILWRKGIGAAWIEKYKNDTDKDFITVERNKVKLPKYYDNILEMQNPEEMLLRKAKRKTHIKQEDQTLERLEQKRKCTEARIKQLVKTL